MNLNDILNEMGISTEFIAIYSVILAASTFIGIICYILQAIGLFKMGKSLSISNPWLSFIPVANIFSLGRVAQKYVKRDGSSSAKFSIWLLVLYILNFVVGCATIIFLFKFIFSIAGYATNAIVDETALTAEMFSGFIPVLILYIIILAISITYQVLYYIALWRVFAIFNNEQATLFLVLSLFFNILPPIFIIAISGAEPKLTYEERIGFDISQY